MNAEPENNINKTVIATYTKFHLAADQFDHPEWTNTQPVWITHRWSGEEADEHQHAEVRLVWTDEALIARFVCRQQGPLIVNSNPHLDRKTIGLWDRDVCEIFISPDPKNPNRYFEFEAAPTGEWVDLAVQFTSAKRETDVNYQSGMTTAARVDDEQVTIAISIPWSASIPKPEVGNEWRVNLFRCVGPGNPRYLAWRPTFTAEPNFHVPSAFGRLTFA